MIRGTTPKHVFSLPFDTGEITALRVSYAQRGKLLFTKSEQECTLLEERVTLQLTQAETLRFAPFDPVQIQVRVLHKDGRAFASRVLTATVEDCLLEEVLE